ncbi:MAG: Stk1 family PASTA domain-containing Ser/Thr kinase [Actinomycetota bacterium]|nr:Stk1 family PASTA domain-containing Ser/Thr kinase [Actinomycetota bacterium]
MEQQVFNDRYQIIAKIGSGGMADVYKAMDSVLERPVAIKVLHRHFAEDEDFVTRFRREAQAAANLNHPNIVSIYDWGSQNSTYFIVMELLEGESLKQHIQSKGVLEPREAMEITKKVLSALSFAHRNDIIHRDIKPHNIIITKDDEVKVTDFGIARAGVSTMTQTGTILGTAHYLSPEQARGHEVGVTSDLYSAGVVLYEMVTGRIPFDGENPVAIALKHVHEAPVRPNEINPKVTPALQTIILKAMAKNPESRYQSAAEMRNDIMRLMEGMPIVAVPPDEQETLIMAPAHGSRNDVTAQRQAPRPIPAPPKAKPNWPAIIIAIVLVLTASAIGGWFLVSSGIVGGPQMITVPDLTEKTEAEAAAMLKAKGLRLGDVNKAFSNTLDPGVIISQQPGADEKLEEGKEVAVTVSMGRELVTVPDVTNDTSAIATNKLNKAGLELGNSEYEFSEEFEQDKVIRTVPEIGEEVPADTKVNLIISKGQDSVQIQDVEGKTAAEAKSILEGDDLQVTPSESFHDSIDIGTVIRTVPIAGSLVKKGSMVTVYVSKGPELITVPKVLEKLEDEANAILVEKGFNIDVQILNGVPASQDNRVISQDPSQGEQRRKGTVVLIVVGNSAE